MSPPPLKIAILLPIEFEYSERLLKGAMEYAREHPEITLIEMPYARGGRPLPEGPLEFGAALVWPYPADIWVERLLDEGVLVLSASPNWQGRGLPLIAFDGMHVEKLAFEHLAAREPRLIAYVGVETSRGTLTWRRDRFLEMADQRGFEAVAFEINLPEGINSVYRLMRPSESGEDLQRFLVDLPKPAALWCDDDYVARFVCSHADQGGLSVPEDIAVLGLGDYSVSLNGKPSISTIPQPGQLIGRRAVELIHEALLEGGGLKKMVIPVPTPPVLERESTANRGLDAAYRQVHQKIQEDACKGLSVAELADMAGVSQVTFTKHFVQVFGCTPGEEIRRVKTKRAKHYLRSTRFTVDRIAELCGFEDPGNFSKFFKRQTGKTASEYRRKGG